MTEQDGSRLSKLIENHARSIFRCFIFEFPENNKGTGLVICFRLVDADRDSTHTDCDFRLDRSLSSETVGARDEELSWFTRANHTILENK